MIRYWYAIVEWWLIRYKLEAMIFLNTEAE